MINRNKQIVRICLVQDTGMECRCGLMAQSIKDTGRRIELMVKGAFGTQMVTNSKEILFRTNQMEKEPTLALMAQYTLDNGSTMCSMDMGKPNGPVAPITSDITIKVRKRDTVPMYGLREISTKANGKII